MDPVDRAAQAEAKRKRAQREARELKKAELPSWLRTKPRTAKQIRQAVEYCRAQGIDYPYEDQ